MGRQAVRQAAQNYLSAQSFPYVGTVFPARDYIGETDYDAKMQTVASMSIPGGSNCGCVIVINITGDDRVRKTATGRGFVEDWTIHKMALELWFANTSGDATVAQLAYDTVVDAIFVAVRADPLLGAPQTIWSAAEFETGISHFQSEPYTDEEGTTVFISGSVRFDAYEWTSGTGV